MEEIAHSNVDCHCGHEDEMHVLSVSLSGMSEQTCRTCTMERDVFPLNFLDDARYAAAHRNFLIERLRLAPEADVDTECRIAYLKLVKTQRDNFLNDWDAHKALLEG